MTQSTMMTSRASNAARGQGEVYEMVRDISVGGRNNRERKMKKKEWFALKRKTSSIFFFVKATVANKGSLCAACLIIKQLP